MARYSRAFRLALAGVLVCSSLADAKTKKPNENKLFQQKLNKDQQALHALDRLTYGPRPGDFERIRKSGVKKWTEEQLRPESIPENPALEARLRPLATLRMEPLEIWRLYPQTQFAATYLAGKSLPQDAAFRGNVEALAHHYRLKATAGANPSAGDLEPAFKLEDLLNPAAVTKLQKGNAADKLAVLRSFPENREDDLLYAMPGNVRNQILGVAPTQLRREIQAMNSPQQLIAYDLIEAKLYRAVYSNRQLAEQLADFWYNHFNVYLDKGNERYAVPLYEQAAIRPRVLGRFRDLLQATAESPAMLFYLDNFQSVAPPPPGKAPGKNVRGLNENYARELLELHTLGVDGGYTQQDIVEIARCFTGWTIRDPRLGNGFYYNDKAHDKGVKVVLGVTIAAGGGQEDGLQVLDILASHPSTARFISRKLAQRFVADEPPQALVEAMAKTFRATGGDIRQVMKTMLSSKEFWSQGAYHAKLKSPFEMIASAARALDVDVESGYELAQQAGVLGQPLYRKLEPTGYSNTSEEWINSGLLLARINFGLNFAQNKYAGSHVDLRQFGAEPDAGEITRRILFADASPKTRETIDNALRKEREKNPKKPPSAGLIAGLVLGSPDFQRR